MEMCGRPWSLSIAPVKLLRELANPNLHDIANMSFHVELWDRHADHLRWVVAAAGSLSRRSTRRRANGPTSASHCGKASGSSGSIRQRRENSCSRSLNLSRTKKEPKIFARFKSARKVARPERFELPTPRFVVWCSIQLSYGRALALSAKARNLVAAGRRRKPAAWPKG